VLFFRRKSTILSNISSLLIYLLRFDVVFRMLDLDFLLAWFVLFFFLRCGLWICRRLDIVFFFRFISGNCLHTPQVICEASTTYETQIRENQM
jgi:hypothetical protein